MPSSKPPLESTLMRHRFRKIYILPILLLAAFLGTCGKTEDELKEMLKDYLVFDTVMINLALSHVPELFAYDRLFTAPSHATAGANIDIPVGACGGTFQAGASRATIAGAGATGTLGTLVGDIPLAGYNRASILAGSVLHEKQNPGAAPHHHFFKRSDGTLDSIDARAVVINCNGTKYAIVIVDTVIMPQDVYDTVFADTSVNAILGNSRARMLLAATHTHSGPGAFATKPLWKLVSGDIFVPAAYTAVTTAIINAIKAADANLQAARMGVLTQTGPSVQKNRRSEYYSSGSAPLDGNMVVAQIQTVGGTPIATIVNFAVHPIALDPSNTLLSSDILGDAMRKYEASTSTTSSDVCIFLNGAEGDVSPSSTLPSPFSMDDIGTKLKDSIVTVVASITFSTTVSIGAAFQPTTLPTPVVSYAPFTSNAALLNMSLGQTVETIGYFNALFFNVNAGAQGLTISTVPGEPITEVGTSIKTASAGQFTTTAEHTMVSALTNGYMGYIVTSSQYDKGGYEAAGTMYGRTTDTTVINAATAAVTAAAN